MSKPFRTLEKEGLEIRVPISIATIIREKAARQRRSIAEVGTDILVRGLGLEPEEYGIESPSPAA